MSSSSSRSMSSVFGCGCCCDSNIRYGCSSAFVLPSSSSTSRITTQQKHLSITSTTSRLPFLPPTNDIFNHDDDAHFFHKRQHQKFMLPPTLSSAAGLHPSISHMHKNNNNRISSTQSSTSTQLHVLDPFTKSACISFFDSIKIPSTIISGLSLAALFTLSKESKDTSFMSRIKILMMRLYHLSSFCCFIMSLTSIITAQTATTMLLFEGNTWFIIESTRKRLTTDAETFLEYMDFEIFLTRWSFIMSMIFLLCSTSFRLFVEFDLFTKRRKTETIMVTSMMCSVLMSCLSCFNTTQQRGYYKNLWYMTKEVIQLFWERIYIKRYPLQIASGCFLIIAALCSLTFLLPTTVNNEKLADHENYT